MRQTFSLEGQYVNIQERTICPCRMKVNEGKIQQVIEISKAPDIFIMPGFIDAHVHIESSLLVPAEFARMAVVHGTVATVSDPHEIANVCGMKGVDFMIRSGRKVNFKFYFGAPSCVPATPFETSGAIINAQDIAQLLKREEIHYLAEMMNWPGVIQGDKGVIEKIRLAQKLGKPIDGHAPGLVGEQALKYAAAGISTDHECFQMEEAIHKINLGMIIAIREGSAAKNFDDLIDLIDHHVDQLMFCSDDKHPDSLIAGHINQLVARAVKKGKDLFDVLKVACLNPIDHYHLQVGRLREGDPADFIMVHDLKDFLINKTYINGELVAENGKTLMKHRPSESINHFVAQPISRKDLELRSLGDKAWVIIARDGQLVTEKAVFDIKCEDGLAIGNSEKDILKIAVINRYDLQPPSIAFIKNFGIQNGAMASSVAHDSHNIIVVGSDDEKMVQAVNLVIENKGGLSAVNINEAKFLPLPIGGLMSGEDGYKITRQYIYLDNMVKDMGSSLQSPYMTLSFMALLVIPEIKLSDKGLFDGKDFKFMDVFTDV
ncbi:MAG: adenine deaminase [Cyclobacteriaceae bacterium]